MAQKEDALYLYLTLKAGYRITTIAPEPQIEVKPPRILFDLASLPGTAWQFETMPVGLKPLVFDASHTEKVIDWLSHPNRSMPVVVLSEYEGEIIHPNANWQDIVVERLFGMALVIRFRAELSWALTERVGKKWSCYHGAVRIYWPKLNFESDPFRHDLMTAEGIMEWFGTDNRRIAADRLLADLFERFRRSSTYSVRCPSVFPELRRATSQERIINLRKQVDTKRDATKATASLATANKQLKEQLAASQQLETEYENELERLVGELARVQNEWDNERLLRETVEKNTPPPSATSRQWPFTEVGTTVSRLASRF